MTESRQLFKKALAYLEEKNIDSPRLSCELIFSDALQIDRLALYTNPSSSLESKIADLIWERVERRARGEPVAYILGYSLFYGEKFWISPAVLIPRPETEFVVESAMELLPRLTGPVLDIGTGSGAIAVTIAQAYPNLSFYGTDICSNALQIAEKNKKKLKNLFFYQDNLLDRPPCDFFELMIANLPYLPSEIIPQLSPEIQFEPRIALDGGKDGLELIRKFIPQAKNRCRYLILEIGDGQFLPVKQLLVDHGFSVVQVKKDLSQMERVVIGKYRG
ncbi:peptide chain release factor N(5)-glutamine methyltransferase [Candidatus Methylacidiphilum fumarolicum]|uniref:Release factor glutamine methyltransferase n=2 Tax=Candidatus Methylacidiphilum fumarolicum TaxID=591154 RepID=I0K004_METFB|nr:peptide chain release factor N(5)-glutamine methyltransferase [Candidatus Methylacidiphilum fumarolicum]MBW6415152.1 peptide chain release factor N(5)-glutamine methyltransferase [Candidatus Methylacidiphilum fumarolicum]TFE65968.1 protein-(glutamine-N5) methyltransferase, release factor-specific [Candidatus Methylacidiphilum fumarolicum]TFE72700.1 peptide chain release factor N(5)-glutamine methyltransferase [Candidatus Methylacidiphilum fumarolicum]TFE73165.1 peptide chain release factor N